MESMVADELAYAMVTSHSINKSRTGNIVSRLISRSGLELVTGAVFSPSEELAARYAEMIGGDVSGGNSAVDELIAGYLREKFIDVDERLPRRRVLMLVFRGPDAVRRIQEVAGEIGVQKLSGETIRDTYGEFVTDAAGGVVFFEPAVLIGESAAEVRRHLELWAEYSDRDSGIRKNAAPYADPSRVEQTLVLIKPDNFRFPNIRPGALIDVFSRTGLCMIGFRVHCMSVAQAEAFYGPVLPALMEHFKKTQGGQVKEMLEERFDLELAEEDRDVIAECIGPIMGRRYWENLIRFMAGHRPSDVAAEDRELPGSRKTIALVYEGEDAVRKIREVLGPTDPSQAPAGTIRREFGTTVMINAAHASDTPENARREMQLIGVSENQFGPYVRAFYGAGDSPPAFANAEKKMEIPFHRPEITL